MKAVAVALREIRAIGGSALGWTCAVGFLLLAGVRFAGALGFYVIQGGFDLHRGLWQYVFHDFRALLVIVVPWLTMRAFAGERARGTDGVVRSLPVRDGELVLGKMLGVSAIVGALLLVAPLDLALLSPFAKTDGFAFVAGCVGLALVAIAYVGVGVLVSSLTRSPIAAAAATTGVLSFFWVVNWNEASLPEAWLPAIRAFSAFDRFHRFARGAIAAGDVVYFGAVAVASAWLAAVALAARRRLAGGAGSGIGGRLRLAGHVALVILLAVAVTRRADAIGAVVDWSPRGAFTLGPLAQRIVETMPGPIRIRAFPEEDGGDAARDVLERFSVARTDLDAQVLDLDRNPGRAREESVGGHGQVSLRAAGRHVVVDEVSEAAIARGLERLTWETAPRLLFTAGHGERVPGRGSGAAGAHDLPRVLSEAGYRIDIARGGIAEAADRGADLLIAWGPRADLESAEIDALEERIARGGGVLLLLDPVSLPRLETWLEGRGISSPPSAIRDPANRTWGLDDAVIRVPWLSPAIRTGEVLPLLLPLARPAEPAGAAGGVLARTSPTAMVDGETGARPVAAAAERDGGEGALVVVGDADFAGDGYLGSLGNRAFASNLVSWMIAPDRPLLSPGSDSGIRSPLILSDRASRTIVTIVVGVAPGLTLLAGVLRVRSRRRRR